MPEISAEQLVERLTKGKAVPAILLLGDDAYLRQMTRQRIIDVSVEPAARDWGLARYSAEDDDLAHVLGHARSVPMLAQRQVIVLSEVEAIEKLRDTARDAAIADLTAYLNDPAPFTVLVLEAEALDQRMKLCKLLLEKAVVVAAELPEDAGERLRMAAALAVQMAHELDAKIEPDAAEELADLCNSSLSAIRSEIEKLATYAGRGKPIRRADVADLVVSEKKYSVWELADILASGQRTRVLLFLDYLLREGEQPPALVGAMAWMFRKLLEAQDLGPNTNSYQAAGRLGMRPATAEMALRQARKIPRSQLVNGLRSLYDADSRLKSGSDNDRAVMEFLVAGLTNTGVTPAPKRA